MIPMFVTLYLIVILTALVYAPVVSYLSEWFVQRRGLANGIIFAGEFVLSWLF